ncbi:TonB-dependent receptor [Sphingosinicella sp. LY1275]|uniref:TonB-dependent receptor n=1 Tax=Sphingosinicella sp. LY1275 TaxID=3095379 RepID=UPI002ADEB1FE|nr:TonB-dependent receptor [Sphingosinicella sp. LY1275]MEA1015658.1 TonB-dependent receptor [Sphingosinicella sp. LY1275]
MLRSVSLTAILLASATPALAQRANENAVASAQDAFGTSVGNERVGLYFPQSARGFSPIQAGNVRINGLYFDYQGDLNQRLISGNNVRVGLTAQGYPFPAPTGVADFSLRLPGSEAVVSTVVGIGPFGGPRLEVDAQLPVTDTLGIAAGVGANDQESYYGGDWRVLTTAIVARWRPTDNVELVPFWSLQDESDGQAQPIIFTGGDYLPPEIPRRRYFGPQWAQNEGEDVNFGLLGTFGFGDWTLRGGAFRSIAHDYRNFTPVFLDATPDGQANRQVIADQARRFASTSGELRLTRQWIEGDRLHLVHLMTRGRIRDRRYGGTQRFDFGPGRIDEPIAAPEPELVLGPQTRDQVRQLTGGIGYEGRWRGVGELTLGIQRTFYEKEVVRPSGPLPVSKASPWLLNGALSVIASDDLVFYAGYSKGLEESPVAPEVAVNNGEAPPAIITEQMDAGFRLNLTDSLRLVAGVFDVRKPYFALDPGKVFRELGAVRNRGIELSLAGQITPRLSIVLGGVFLDAEVSGDEVELGLIGKKPVGSIGRVVTGALNWNLPWVDGLSLDISYESRSKTVANADNSFVIPGRYVISPGVRYRFDIADKPATFRAQVGTLNSVYGFSNIGEGFYYNQPRRFQMSLTVDM